MTLIAAAQFGPVLGDPDANRATAAGAVRDAAAQGARLVVLPELSDSGYVFTGPDEAPEATPGGEPAGADPRTQARRPYDAYRWDLRLFGLSIHPAHATKRR